MKQSKRRSPEELQDQRRSQFVDDIAKIRVQWNALKELLPTIVVKEIKIINDSDETFDFEIYLQPNQKDRLKKLWELACMEIPTCSAEGDGYCRWGASMVSFGSEWIYLDFRMAFLKKFSKNILPDDTPIRALEMWRNFVAKHVVHIEPELALERKTHREGISNRGAAAPQVCPRPRPGIDPMW